MILQDCYKADAEQTAACHKFWASRKIATPDNNMKLREPFCRRKPALEACGILKPFMFDVWTRPRKATLTTDCLEISSIKQIGFGNLLECSAHRSYRRIIVVAMAENPKMDNYYTLFAEQEIGRMCKDRNLIDDTIAKGCEKQLSILIPTSELQDTRSLEHDTATLCKLPKSLPIFHLLLSI